MLLSIVSLSKSKIYNHNYLQHLYILSGADSTISAAEDEKHFMQQP